MKIIIVGDGKVGLELTRQLLQEEHEVVVIDSNHSILRENLEQYDVMTVTGNGASMETLRQAGAETADLLIAATSTDEVNLFCCLTVKKLNTRIHTIARIRNTEYTEQLFVMREELGLSMTINPELSAAQEIFRLLQFPSFLRRDTFARSRIEIVEIQIDENSRLNDLPLSQLYQIAKVKVLVCAVVRGKEVAIPSGSFVLQKGDHIYVTAKAGNLTQLIKNLFISARKVRQVMIIGGSRISGFLTEKLLDSGVGVKIIEQNLERAKALAERFPQASVVCGDGSSQEILDQEGLAQTDALVTLTDMDEENIIISTYGNSLKVGKVVTKINRPEYSDMFANLGLGSIVSPKELCSNNIVRYVRAMQHQMGSVLAMHRIADGRAETLEFRVDRSVQWVNTPLKDIPLKPGILISCITHQSKTIIPDGSSQYEIGDTVVVVTTVKTPIRRMNDIFVG